MNKERKIASTTTFKKVPTNRFEEGVGIAMEWYWSTKGANNEPLGGSMGEGYKNLFGALNGFFAQQGFTDWGPRYPVGVAAAEAANLVVPEDYGQVVKVDPNTYTVTKYANTQKDDTNANS